MQFTGDETPAGPAVYRDSSTFGLRCTTVEPPGVSWDARTVLENVLDGLPPRERESVLKKTHVDGNEEE